MRLNRLFWNFKNIESAVWSTVIDEESSQDGLKTDIDDSTSNETIQGILNHLYHTRPGNQLVKGVQQRLKNLTVAHLVKVKRA